MGGVICTHYAHKKTERCKLKAIELLILTEQEASLPDIYSSSGPRPPAGALSAALSGALSAALSLAGTNHVTRLPELPSGCNGSG